MHTMDRGSCTAAGITRRHLHALSHVRQHGNSGHGDQAVFYVLLARHVTQNITTRQGPDIYTTQCACSSTSLQVGVHTNETLTPVNHAAHKGAAHYTTTAIIACHKALCISNTLGRSQLQMQSKALPACMGTPAVPTNHGAAAAAQRAPKSWQTCIDACQSGDHLSWDCTCRH